MGDVASQHKHGTHVQFTQLHNGFLDHMHLHLHELSNDVEGHVLGDTQVRRPAKASMQPLCVTPSVTRKDKFK
jgi:hypothetical protein